MKCDTCKYGKMCFLRKRHMEMIDIIIADITDTCEPEYSKTCKTAAELFAGCVNYEEGI
ncbi:hypothetical protein LCGC14_3153110 [marine sediment metagenome]|uniref:Uncharacterized protein n=1 Tax=marine sediment metagenome TaxID=412755 RepID=A0A0F8WHJ3_9ZZZZ